MDAKLAAHKHPILHLAEECAEVIQDCMKGMHHGFKPTIYENVRYNNRKKLQEEIMDLRAALDRAEQWLADYRNVY